MSLQKKARDILSSTTSVPASVILLRLKLVRCFYDSESSVSYYFSKMKLQNKCSIYVLDDLLKKNKLKFRNTNHIPIDGTNNMYKVYLALRTIRRHKPIHNMGYIITLARSNSYLTRYTIALPHINTALPKREYIYFRRCTSYSSHINKSFQ